LSSTNIHHLPLSSTILLLTLVLISNIGKYAISNLKKPILVYHFADALLFQLTYQNQTYSNFHDYNSTLTNIIQCWYVYHVLNFYLQI
ncbi:hypothetical protein, partial [Staphylococcus haemolyticus]|uniref:hypothetical protein n=1 Tax=Staphylococcus haemolyticus TaxID=1283 RepID=UPI001C5CB5B1